MPTSVPSSSEDRFYSYYSCVTLKEDLPFQGGVIKKGSQLEILEITPQKILLWAFFLTEEPECLEISLDEKETLRKFDFPPLRKLLTLQLIEFWLQKKYKPWEVLWTWSEYLEPFPIPAPIPRAVKSASLRKWREGVRLFKKDPSQKPLDRAEEVFEWWEATGAAPCSICAYFDDLQGNPKRYYPCFSCPLDIKEVSISCHPIWDELDDVNSSFEEGTLSTEDYLSIAENLTCRMLQVIQQLPTFPKEK